MPVGEKMLAKMSSKLIIIRDFCSFSRGSLIGKSQNDMSHQYQRCNPKNVDLSTNVSITFNTKSSALVSVSSLHSFSVPPGRKKIWVIPCGLPWTMGQRGRRATMKRGCLSRLGVEFLVMESSPWHLRGYLIGHC